MKRISILLSYTGQKYWITCRNREIITLINKDINILKSYFITTYIFLLLFYILKNIVKIKTIMNNNRKIRFLFFSNILPFIIVLILDNNFVLKYEIFNPSMFVNIYFWLIKVLIFRLFLSNNRWTMFYRAIDRQHFAIHVFFLHLLYSLYIILRHAFIIIILLENKFSIKQLFSKQNENIIIHFLYFFGRGMMQYFWSVPYLISEFGKLLKPNGPC